MRTAACGGITPNWLGAAQLKAGGSYPVSSEKPSHRRELPLAPHSTPIELRLITGICNSPCCVYAMGEVGVSSPVWPVYNVSVWALVGSKPGQNDMEDKMLPMQHAPPLHVSDGSKGTAGCYNLAPEPSQDRCQNRVEYNARNCLRVSDSGFFLRVYSRSLCLSKSGHKAVADSWW